jgi:hypothetical protein
MYPFAGSNTAPSGPDPTVTVGTVTVKLVDPDNPELTLSTTLID